MGAMSWRGFVVMVRTLALLEEMEAHGGSEVEGSSPSLVTETKSGRMQEQEPPWMGVNEGGRGGGQGEPGVFMGQAGESRGESFVESMWTFGRVSGPFCV